MRKRRRHVSNIVQRMLAASARAPRMWRALFAAKLRDFPVENRTIKKNCVENFENQRDRSRRRTQNADNTIEQSLDACCAGRTGYPELCSVFGDLNLRKNFTIFA